MEIYQLGKLPKKHDKRTLQFSKYKTDELPPPPDTFISAKSVDTWPMYDNDRYGDCTWAAAGHAVQIFQAAAGLYMDPPDQDVLDMYFLLNNNGQPFQPGAPQDTGCSEIDVLNLWRSKLISGVGPFAYVEINPQNQEDVKLAISLFGCVYFGFAMPESAQGQDSWTGTPQDDQPNTQPGSWGGHAVVSRQYSPSGIPVLSWGKELEVTWEFQAAYGDEAYGILPNDWENRPGFDWSTLQSDLLILGQQNDEVATK